VPSWRCLSSSVAGTSHVTRDLPCQDAHQVVSLENGDLVIAVADGCGSSKRSDEGSLCAVKVSTQFIADRLESSGRPTTGEECAALLESAVAEAATAVTRLAGAGDPLEVATTLLLTLVTDSWLATIQVGDGAIVSRDKTGQLAVISSSVRGEYVNETTFITSPTYLSNTVRSVFPSEAIIGIAVFSDGIEFLAVRYSDQTAHAPFFTAMFDFATNPGSTPEELQAFLLSDRVGERTDDDKTLVLAVRHDIP